MVNALARAIPSLTICFLIGWASEGVIFGQEGRVRPVQQVTVKDSRGKTVGRAFGGVNVHNIESSASTDLNVRTIVLLRVDEHIVPVMVGRDRFYGGRNLLFESENCVGTAWLPPPADPTLPETDAPSLMPPAAIGPPGNTLYVATPGAPSRPITISSLLKNAIC